MRLTQEEIDILRDLSRKVKFRRTARKRGADYDLQREERLAQWARVGDIINRYELWLGSQEQDKEDPHYSWDSE